MPIFAPLKITLYDPETDEVKKDYTRSFIPWRLLKKSIRMSKVLANIDQENLQDEDVDAITSLVVDVFNDQFTVEELNNGADLMEMIAVIQGIIARAEGVPVNPPPKGK